MRSKHIELPALPDHKGVIYLGEHQLPNRAFTAEQMQAYGLAAIAAHEQARVVGEPVARLHITATDTYPDVDVEVLDGTHLQPNMSPVSVYLTPQEAQALPENETEAMHDAVMAVLYKTGGIPRTRTNELWQAYRSVLAAAPVAQPATDTQQINAGCRYTTELMQPATEAEQAEAPSDADPLTPEQEEWVMDLAEKHNLGRRVPQIGAMRGVAPDVFYTDASYRTHELFCFAAELLSTKEQS